MKKKIFIALGVIILFIIIAGALGGNKNSQPTTNNTQQKVASEPKKTAEKISVRDLADDFDSNQVAAEAKWKDKFVEFSGEISNITDTGTTFSNIATKQFSLTQISCRITDKQSLLSLKNGQTVTVRGTVGTQMIGVIEIKDCKVIE